MRRRCPRRAHVALRSCLAARQRLTAWSLATSIRPGAQRQFATMIDRPVPARPSSLEPRRGFAEVAAAAERHCAAPQAHPEVDYVPHALLPNASGIPPARRSAYHPSQLAISCCVPARHPIGTAPRRHQKIPPSQLRCGTRPLPPSSHLWESGRRPHFPQNQPLTPSFQLHRHPGNQRAMPSPSSPPHGNTCLVPRHHPHPGTHGLHPPTGSYHSTNPTPTSNLPPTPPLPALMAENGTGWARAVRCVNCWWWPGEHG